MNNIFITLMFNKKIDDIDIFINNFKNIYYDKNNIYLYIVSTYYELYDRFNEYKHIYYFEKFSDEVLNKSFYFFLNSNCDYYYYIDSSVILNNKNIFEKINNKKIEIVTPVLYLENSDISNLNITENINNKCIKNNKEVDIYDKLNNIIIISRNIIKKINYPYFENLFKEIDNNKYSYNFILGKDNNFGYIKESNFINIKYDKLYSNIFNMDDIKLWEDRFLHDEFKKYLNGEQLTITEPIPYLFEFPLFNERFCNEMIRIMENNNKWSGGRHIDKRLNSGYENVPTVDTQFNQIGFEKQWNKIVFKYISKIAKKGFVGSHTSSINMSFVVKYTPSGQSNLKPHNDSSLYSAMVALNKRGIDFEGGGTRFIRYDYKHLTQKPGYCVIFPGKLTHYHEGLETTKGTRYIIVSFIE